MTGIAGPRTAHVSPLMVDDGPVHGLGHTIWPPENGG